MLRCWLLYLIDTALSSRALLKQLVSITYETANLLLATPRPTAESVSPEH